MPDPVSRSTLRDLAGTIGLLLVVVVVAGALAWWYPGARPRIEIPGPRVLDALAVIRAQRDTLWHTLPLHLPPDLVFSTAGDRLEVIEVTPPSGRQGWPARMALLDLTLEADARFQAASYNCGLGDDRCWVDSAGTTAILCQRSSGTPDPELAWTPHLECQVPARGVRMVANAPSPRLREFEELFRDALRAP